MKIKALVCLVTVTALLGETLPVAAPISANESKYIALTFDDGPNTTTTNEVLDLLEQYDAKATFFLIGNNINEESAVAVKRAYDMGCEIGNHSKTHSNMSSMTVEEIQAEIDYVDEKVIAITGETTRFFRPPFIDTSETMYDAIDKPFICGIDCQDYMANVTAQERADYILNGAKDGVIVLLHDASGNDQTVEALTIVMPQLIEQGYEFVTLTELFQLQGETPNESLLYSEVAKYPCDGYTLYENMFTGSLSGDNSASCWNENTILDPALLKELGTDYAIEVQCESVNPPVIALQKWSGASIWSTVKPFYYNGETACFLADDILATLDTLAVDYTDLDRMSIRPNGGTMTMTQIDILVKAEAPADETLLGDVDCDGYVRIDDVILLNRFLAEDVTIAVTDAGMRNAECDGTDTLTGEDAAAILRILAGL